MGRVRSARATSIPACRHVTPRARHRRYFVLYRDRLCYYRNQGATVRANPRRGGTQSPLGRTVRLNASCGPFPPAHQVRGVIPLSQATKVVPCDAPSGKYGFSVVPGVGKPIYLAAGALLVTQRWMVTLQSIADGARPPSMSKHPSHDRSVSTSSLGSSSVRARQMWPVTAASQRPPSAHNGRSPLSVACTDAGGCSELGRQRG